MAVNEHDRLISEYQKYKDEVAEYEKKMYLYTSRVEDYAKEVTAQISELKRLGVNTDFLKDFAEPDGTIDLTNAMIVRSMIDAVYALYRENVEVGLKILEDRKLNE